MNEDEFNTFKRPKISESEPLEPFDLEKELSKATETEEIKEDYPKLDDRFVPTYKKWRTVQFIPVDQIRNEKSVHWAEVIRPVFGWEDYTKFHYVPDAKSILDQICNPHVQQVGFLVSVKTPSFEDLSPVNTYSYLFKNKFDKQLESEVVTAQNTLEIIESQITNNIGRWKVFYAGNKKFKDFVKNSMDMDNIEYEIVLNSFDYNWGNNDVNILTVFKTYVSLAHSFVKSLEEIKEVAYGRENENLEVHDDTLRAIHKLFMTDTCQDLMYHNTYARIGITHFPGLHFTLITTFKIIDDYLVGTPAEECNRYGEAMKSVIKIASNYYKKFSWQLRTRGVYTLTATEQFDHIRLSRLAGNTQQLQTNLNGLTPDGWKQYSVKRQTNLEHMLKKYRPPKYVLTTDYISAAKYILNKNLRSIWRAGMQK